MCASGAGTEETDGERIRLARVGVVASGRGRGGHPVRADGIERQDRKSVTVRRKNHRALTVPVTVICERDGSRRVARSLYYSIDKSSLVAKKKLPAPILMFPNNRGKKKNNTPIHTSSILLE